MPSGVWGEIIYNIIAQTDSNTDKSVHCYVIHYYTIPTHTFDEFAKKNIMQSNIFLAIYFYSNIFVTYSISTTVVIKPSHTIHTYILYVSLVEEHSHISLTLTTGRQASGHPSYI